MITHMVTPDSTSSPPNSPYGEDTVKLSSSVISTSSPVTSTNYLHNLQFLQQQVHHLHMLQQQQQQQQQQQHQQQQQQQQQQAYQTNYTSTPVDQLFQFDNSSSASFNPVRPPTIGGVQRSPFQNLQPVQNLQQPPPPPQQQHLPPPPQLPTMQQQPPQQPLETQSQPLQQNSFYNDYINDFGGNTQHPYSVFVNPQAASSVTSLPNLDAHQPLSNLMSVSQPPPDFGKLSTSSAPAEATSFLYNLQNQSTDLILNQDLEFSNASFESIRDYSQPSMGLPYPHILPPHQNQFHDAMPTNPQHVQVQDYPHTPSHLSEPPSAGLSDVSNFTGVLDESHLYRPPSAMGHRLKSPILTSTPQHNISNLQPPPTSVAAARHKITKKSSLSRLNTSSRKNLQASLAHSLSTPTELDGNSPPPDRVISPVLKSKASFANIKMEVSDPEEEEHHVSGFSHPPPVIGSTPTGSIGIRSISNASSTSSHGSHHGLPVMNVFRHNSDVSIPTTAQLNQPLKKPPRKTRGPTITKAKRVTSKSSTDSTKTESESGEDTDAAPVKKKHTRRRLLPRSKKGCWICRIKHLKCDEVTPVCGGCAKFGLQCDYSPEKPDYVTDKYLRQQKLDEVSLIRKKNQAKTKIPKKKSKRDLKKSTSGYIS
ncbi:Transcriptional regulatory protein UME6 [Candida viswanathii]|uniref:Transcriptional regulatory protein UME6 n=1 Tax=Candida viswanathii TaxID=5486 RepID=A0A367XR63_9ASCO|nr:Transcriptional regulatory protein UME6 [Candida viswanathii]